eukprot:2273978-Prymnesium_polylepis.2
MHRWCISILRETALRPIHTRLRRSVVLSSYYPRDHLLCVWHHPQVPPPVDQPWVLSLFHRQHTFPLSELRWEVPRARHPREQADVPVPYHLGRHPDDIRVEPIPAHAHARPRAKQGVLELTVRDLPLQPRVHSPFVVLHVLLIRARYRHFHHELQRSHEPVPLLGLPLHRVRYRILDVFRFLHHRLTLDVTLVYGHYVLAARRSPLTHRLTQRREDSAHRPRRPRHRLPQFRNHPLVRCLARALQRLNRFLQSRLQRRAHRIPHLAPARPRRTMQDVRHVAGTLQLAADAVPLVPP